MTTDTVSKEQSVHRQVEQAWRSYWYEQRRDAVTDERRQFCSDQLARCTAALTGRS